MILVKIIGGLGNQMFQYAAGRALADRLGVELVLDVRGFANYNLRRFELDRLRVRARVANRRELLGYPRVPRRVLTATRRFGIGARYYLESDLTYDPAVAKLPSGTHLTGFFQDERYFSNIRNVLVDDLSPSAPPTSRNLQLAEQIKGCESIVIHVRRGDYVSNAHTNEVHGVCSLDYYRRAIDHLRGCTTNPHFFVFSDDLAWAAEHLPLDGTVTFVDGNGDNPELDIWLMARGAHHIIANSSFSWWGAWLSDRGGITVAPTPWFTGLHAPELVPARWKRLPR